MTFEVQHYRQLFCKNFRTQTTNIYDPPQHWVESCNPQDSMSSYMMVEILQQAPKLFFRGSPHITKWIAWHCNPQPERSSHRPFWTLWWGVWERVCGSWNRHRKPKGAEKQREQLACAGQPRMDHSPVQRGDQGKVGGLKTPSSGQPNHTGITPQVWTTSGLSRIDSFWCS